MQAMIQSATLSSGLPRASIVSGRQRCRRFLWQPQCHEGAMVVRLPSYRATDRLCPALLVVQAFPAFLQCGFQRESLAIVGNGDGDATVFESGGDADFVGLGVLENV